MSDYEEDIRIVGQTPNYVHSKVSAYFNPNENSPNRKACNSNDKLIELDSIKEGNQKTPSSADYKTSSRTPNLEKLKRALGSTNPGSLFRDALNLVNQDTPEQDRQSEIKQKLNIKSKETLIENLAKFQATNDLDMPSISTQQDRIQLNDESVDRSEMLDTPLKNKISIQALRMNRSRNEHTLSDKKKGFEMAEKLNTMAFSPSGTDDVEITEPDNDVISKDSPKILGLQNSNNILTIASKSSSSNSRETRGLRNSQPVNTQLIQSISNDFDVTENIMKQDRNSILSEETSILHTSPINFTSFHHSLHPSTQILISGVETQKSSRENEIVVQSPSAAVNGDAQILTNFSSAGTDAGVNCGALDSQSSGDLNCHKTPQPNEMRFKLTYSIKPSSQNMSPTQYDVMQTGTQTQPSFEEHENTMENVRMDTNIEVDQTQELPEIFESSEKEKKPCFESQELVAISKKRQKQFIIEEEVDFEDSSTPNKRHREVSFGLSRYPTNIRSEDTDYLTSEDIRFADAVWYYYTDCNYYPGKLLSSTTIQDNRCTVLFEKQQNDVKTDDIYYLDLRCGERVQWDRNEYEVSALECKKGLHDQDVIRCVRGYDTVHLRKVLRNGKLSKNFIVKDIASISITPKEWLKRLKIYLDVEKPNSRELLDRPTRSRSARTSLSPIKRQNNVQSTPGPEYYNDTFHDTTIMSELNVNRGNIFHRCLFMISGLNDMDRKKIVTIIELQAGHVITAGLDQSLSYDNGERVFQWVNKQYEQFRFVCLLSANYSRSPKYLETLALGWPVVHWKFIEHCVSIGFFDKSSIFRFLLPSGESVRLSKDSSSKQCVIKSSNIFRFYTNLINSVPLSGQFGTSTVNLHDFAVFIFGHSEMDSFLNFTFQCFNVKAWEFSALKRLKQDVLDQETVQQLLSFINVNTGSRLIIFVNDTNLSNMYDWEKSIESALSLKGIEESIDIENKEWLIQLIINESI